MITEDVAKLVVQIENSSKNGELQNELAILQQKTGSLKDENKRLATAMEVLRAQGKQNSDEFKKIKEDYDANSRSIIENEKRMKTLRQAMNNAGLSANDLRKKATELQRELNGMTRAADPERFDRLNKELKETQRQLQQVRAGTSETGTAMGNLINIGKKFLPALGIGAAIGLVKQFGSAVIDTFKSTQGTGDAWNAMVSGMENAYKTFLRTITTGDWSNFFTNMSDAYRVGKEVAEMLDELFERNNSFQITDAIAKRDIENLYEIQKNITKSIEERKAAGEEIITITRKQADAQIDIIQQELNAHQKKLDQVTKMTDAEKEYFIQNYNQNIVQIRQASDLLKIEKEYREEMLNVMKTDSRGNTYIDPLAEENAEKLKTELDLMRESIKEFEYAYNTLKKYNNSSDDIITPYVGTLVKMINVTTESERSLRRVKAQNSSFEQQLAEDEKKRKEDKYKDEIAAAEDRNRELRKTEVQKYEREEMDQITFKAKIEALEEQLIRKKIEINLKYNKETNALEDQLLTRATKRADDLAKMNEEQREKEYKAKLDASEDFYRDERKKQAEQYTQGLIDKAQYDDSIKSLEQLLLQEKLALNIQYGKDTSAIEDQIVAYQIKCYEDVQKALDEQEENNKGKKLEREKQLESEAAAIITELRSQNIREYMNFELAQLEELYNEQKKLNNKSLISEKQYEQKKLQIKLEAAQKYAQQAGQLAQLGSNLVTAVQDAEYARLDAQKEKELALAGDNAEERQRIEEEYEAKKLEVQKKYADLDMAAKIAQTIAAGALAVIQAFAQLGPIGGAISAVLIGATTAFQIAAIVQQRNAIKSMSPGGSGSSASTSQRVVLPGREEGGYVDAEREQDGRRFRARRRRRRGYVGEPTVLTGEAGPEFVANDEAVANPTIRPVLDLIDIAQQMTRRWPIPPSARCST